MRVSPLRLGVLGGLVVGLAIAGCAPQSEEATTPDAATSNTTASEASETTTESSEPQVVATTALLCDITSAIAQETIALTCLMPPGQDPHSYRLKPSDRRAIEEADLVLDNGYDLVPGLTEVAESASDAATFVAVGELAVPDPLLYKAHDHSHHDGHEQYGDEHDQEHGDEHEGHDESKAHDEHGDEHDHDDRGDAHSDELVPDPHIWHDARNGAAIATVVAEQLAKVNPDRADDYSTKAAALGEQLARLHTWITDQIATVPEAARQLITAHDAFGYFATAYGIEQSSALAGLSPQKKPSPTTLVEIVEGIKASGVPAIFAESTSSTTLVDAVAKDAEVIVAPTPLLVDSPNPDVEGAATYPEMLAYNTCVMVDALGGTCDREALGF